MSILVNKDTRVVCQGITGSAGSFHSRQMLAYGTQLVAGVTPGRSGQDVEVGCLGGHGRTGTALACLAVLTGHPSRDAVAWVRSSYCAKAVETQGQEAFVAALSC